MITATFTNEKDALNFAFIHQSGYVDVEINHIAGKWIVTVTKSSRKDKEIGFTLSDIEVACGVTMESVSQMASIAGYSHDDDGEPRIVFPRSTSAALASATSRFLLGAETKFSHISKPSGMVVYKKA